MYAIRIGLLLLFCCAFPTGFAATAPNQMNYEEKVYRTGLTSKRGDFSVSPDGSRILFSTNRLSDGLRLLDLRTGKIEVIPVEHGRTWEMSSWSADGKRVVAISTAVHDNRYIVGQQQVILIDPSNWKHSQVTDGESVRILPFFSADGKVIYYFKGKRRESGKTVASRFGLYAIDLGSEREELLAAEEFYQVGLGDDQAGVILFRAIPYSGFGVKEGEARSIFLTFEARYRNLRLFRMDFGKELHQIRTPKRDKAGNVYFVAATVPVDGGNNGNFRWFVFKATPEGKAPAILTELPISMGFDIARNTGEIYVMDKQNDEIVFRRLSVLADH